MKLNKGEWSELFIGLLSLEKGELRLYKSTLEMKVNSISYNRQDFISKNDIKNINLNEIKKSLNEASGVFSLSSDIVKKIGFKKGGSKSKVDIILRYLLQDEQLEGDFGIKSSIGGKPSILNASRATNFRYSIRNTNNQISKEKAKNLVDKIEINDIKFEFCLSNIFSNNLKMIDTNLDIILSKILITYFQRKGNKIPELVDKTFNDINQKQQVKQRIKDFLYYTCVGMFPTKPWDGREEIVGKLVYTQTEDLFCLHRIDINNFKDYIYENSVLDTASTTRHEFGYLFNENNQTFLDLNLLIRMS